MGRGQARQVHPGRVPLHQHLGIAPELGQLGLRQPQRPGVVRAAPQNPHKFVHAGTIRSRDGLFLSGFRVEPVSLEIVRNAE